MGPRQTVLFKGSQSCTRDRDALVVESVKPRYCGINNHSLKKNQQTFKCPKINFDKKCFYLILICLHLFNIDILHLRDLSACRCRITVLASLGVQ